MHPEEPDDRSLIREVLAGEADRFEALVRRHQGLAYGIVNRRIDRRDADDVAQDVFVRAFAGLNGYRGDRPFANWLSIIAVRACCDHWRKHYRKRELPVSSLTEDCRRWLENLVAEGPEANQESAFLQKQAFEALASVLERLDPEDRMVVTLTHLEERSGTETAELLGWSLAKVKVQAFRARARMKKILRGLMGPEA